MNGIDMTTTNVNLEEALANFERTLNFEETLANFEGTLGESLKQNEKDFFWDILHHKDERTELQKLLDRYDMYVWREQKEREELIEKLKDIEKCKDFDQLDNFENRIKDMRERVDFNLDNQNEVIDKIFNKIRNNLSEEFK